MNKRRIIWSLLLSLVFVFALGVAGASATDVTWNPNDKNPGVVLYDDNMTVGPNYGYDYNVRCTGNAPTSGKYYWEITILDDHSDARESGKVGIMNVSTDISQLVAMDYWRYASWAIGTQAGDTSGFLLDLDNRTFSIKQPNGQVDILSNNLDNTKIYKPALCVCGTNLKIKANFGATSFKYPVPEGYQSYNNIEQQAVPVPTNLVATSGDTQVILNWSSVTGATSYKVYKGTASGTYEATQVATVDAPTTTATITGLTNGTPYYYIVKAVTASGDSGPSNEATATPTAGSNPPPATGNGTLIVTVANNADREYNLTMAQIQAFIDWYNNRSTGGSVYTIEKTATAPYTKVKDYLIFDKIVAWQVKEY